MLKPQELPAALDRGLVKAYLVAGDEPLLVTEAQDLIRKTTRNQGFDEHQVLEVRRDDDWQELIAATESQSLFSSRKLIELHLPTGKPGRKGSDAISECVERLDGDTILLVISGAWNTRMRSNKWVKAIDQAGQVVEVWPVKAQELPGFLRQRLSQHGFQADNEALNILADRVEGNLMAADQEIRKLAMFMPDGGTLTAEIVAERVVDDARADGFRLVERMLLGELAGTLRTIDMLRRTDAPLPPLVWAVSNEVQVLAAYVAATRGGQRPDQAMRQLRIWYNRQAPIKAAAARLSPRQLAAVLSQLAVLERLSKGRPGNEQYREFWLAMEHVAQLLCVPETEAA